MDEKIKCEIHAVRLEGGEKMTNFLVKHFVKDYENIESNAVRTSYGILASVIGIICNVFLFIVKFIIGLLIHSITVTADSFNNLSDAASSIISFVGVKMANRPADKEHPFGHGRAEYVSALIVAFLVVQVGFTCFKSSFDKVLHPQLISFDPILVGILALSILVKVWMASYNAKLGKKIQSKVMLATSADARGDVIITSATVLSILIGHFTKLAIDGYAGIIVSIFVLISGYNIAKDTLEPLLGEAIDRELYEKITDIVESFDGIKGTHDLIIHSYGPTRQMATIHAEVSNQMGIEEAHELIDKIEREVFRERNVYLVIHMDPVELDNEVVKEKKEQVTAIVKSFDDTLSIHDFRMMICEQSTRIFFDLLLSYSYNKKQEEEIVKKIHEEVEKLEEHCECVISVDYSYLGD